MPLNKETKETIEKESGIILFSIFIQKDKVPDNVLFSLFSFFKRL